MQSNFQKGKKYGAALSFIETGVWFYCAHAQSKLVTFDLRCTSWILIVLLKADGFGDFQKGRRRIFCSKDEVKAVAAFILCMRTHPVPWSRLAPSILNY